MQDGSGGWLSNLRKAPAALSASFKKSNSLLELELSEVSALWGVSAGPDLDRLRSHSMTEQPSQPAVPIPFRRTSATPYYPESGSSGAGLPSALLPPKRVHPEGSSPQSRSSSPEATATATAAAAAAACREQQRDHPKHPLSPTEGALGSSEGSPSVSPSPTSCQHRLGDSKGESSGGRGSSGELAGQSRCHAPKAVAFASDTTTFTFTNPSTSSSLPPSAAVAAVAAAAGKVGGPFSSGDSECGSGSTEAGGLPQSLRRGSSTSSTCSKLGPLPKSGQAQLDRYLEYLLSKGHPHKFLYYPGWGLSDEACGALGEFLRRNVRIKVVTLSGNAIRDEGVELIADGLSFNNTLVSLDLSYNRFGNMGAISLAEALRGNTSLTELQLSSNRIGDEGAEALAAAVANCSLKKLQLSGNMISQAQQKVVAHVLKTRTYKLPPTEGRGKKSHLPKNSSLQFDIELTDNLEELQKSPQLQQLQLPPATAVAALSEASCVMESGLHMQALHVLHELGAKERTLVLEAAAEAVPAAGAPAAAGAEAQQGLPGCSSKPASCGPPAAAQGGPCEPTVGNPSPAKASPASGAPSAAAGATPASTGSSSRGGKLGDTPLMVLLAQRVARLGYEVTIRCSVAVRELVEVAPGVDAGSDTEGTTTTTIRSLAHAFVRVVQPGELTAPVIVDPFFKEQFEISHPTARYRAVLDALPPVLVLLESRIWHLVELLCREMQAAFDEQGGTLPPWRSAAVIMSKWVPTNFLDLEVDEESRLDWLETEFNKQMNKAATGVVVTIAAGV